MSLPTNYQSHLKDTKRKNDSKIRQERSSMKHADYKFHRPTPWMQESASMHRKTQLLSGSPHSYMKRVMSKEERQERQRSGGWWKEKQPNKTLPAELKLGLHAQLRLTMLGEEGLTSPSHITWHPALFTVFQEHLAIYVWES